MASLSANVMEAIARGTLRMEEVCMDDDKTFRSFFGAPIPIVTMVWNRIVAKPPTLDRGAHPRHLLWALVLLKCHCPTPALSCMIGWPCEKTFHKWCWHFISRIAVLKEDVIKLDDRFIGWDGTTICLVSVDGIDCMINEPWPFKTKWHSQKFNGPAVKCEVAVCIETARIVWIDGPFPAGKGDSEICKEGLLTLLADDEGVEVDGGCKGDNRFKNPIAAVSRDG